MSFLKKLLGRKQITVTLAPVPAEEYARVIGELQLANDAIKDLQQQLRGAQDAAGLFIAQRTTARAEAEANKADAEAHRRSKANLALGTAASAAKRKAAANG